MKLYNNQPRKGRMTLISNDSNLAYFSQSGWKVNHWIQQKWTEVEAIFNVVLYSEIERN